MFLFSDEEHILLDFVSQREKVHYSSVCNWGFSELGTKCSVSNTDYDPVVTLFRTEERKKEIFNINLLSKEEHKTTRSWFRDRNNLIVHQMKLLMEIIDAGL